MKKIIAVLLVVLMMAVFCISAFAEGEVPLSEQYFFGGGDLFRILIKFLGIFFPFFR